jgi:hypothetical protein
MNIEKFAASNEQVDVNESPINELAELELAYVGGGIGETTL